MNLHDLKRICDTYVPEASRHMNSWVSLRKWDGPRWWHAHEIGHLLIAKPEDIGLPMFGLTIDDANRNLRVALLTECVAMSISHKLLRACRRPDLADEEGKDTDDNTIAWGFDHVAAVKAFAHKRGVARIPRTTKGLECMVLRKLGR